MKERNQKARKEEVAKVEIKNKKQQGNRRPAPPP